MTLTVTALDISMGTRWLCRQLNFSLAPGERMAILGRNGAGKSTLLLTLAGLRPIEQGQVLLNSQPLLAIAPMVLARLRGYCPQQQHDAFASSVLETALIGRHPHLGRWDWEGRNDEAIAHAALAEVGLSALASRQVHTLSGGERQRLALATLLVQSPQLYLLDEPLTHLDLNHAIAMLALFAARTQAQQATMVTVLHDPNLARRYCQRALLLFDDGEWLEGPSEEVLTTDHLSRLYGYPLQALSAEEQPWFVPRKEII